MTELTAEQIESWRANWLDDYSDHNDLAGDVVNCQEINALCDMAKSGMESAARLKALLEGLECEKIDTLLCADQEVLRYLGVEIAKVARLGAHLWLDAPRTTSGTTE